MRFNDTKPDKELSKLDESFTNLRMNNAIKNFVSSSRRIETTASNPSLGSPPKEIKEPTRRNMRKNHPEIQIIGDPIERVQTRASLRLQGHTKLISQIEPKHIDEAMQDENWVIAMQKKLNQFQKKIMYGN